VLKGVGAQNPVKLPVPERQSIDIDFDELGQRCVRHNIRVDAPSVSGTATDVKIPPVPSKDTSFEPMITHKMRHPKHSDCRQSYPYDIF